VSPVAIVAVAMRMAPFRDRGGGQKAQAEAQGKGDDGLTTGSAAHGAPDSCMPVTPSNAPILERLNSSSKDERERVIQITRKLVISQRSSVGVDLAHDLRRPRWVDRRAGRAVYRLVA
jgi:hypothetical protein